jgi:hypothetical protein
MSDNTNMTGAAAAGGGGGGGDAAATFAKVPVQHPTKFIHFIIHSHGSIPFGECPAEFQVPQNIALGFFYDPTKENTTICFTPNHIQQICFGAIDTPYMYEHPHKVPNLLLERMDDVGLLTGIFNCQEKKFLPIPSLGPVEPQPYVASAHRPSVCLETVVQVLQYQYSDYFIGITVLACGVTTKYKIHPERIKTVYPEFGGKVVAKMNTTQVNAMVNDYMKRGYTRNSAFKLATQFVRQVGGRSRTRKLKRKGRNHRNKDTKKN